LQDSSASTREFRFALSRSRRRPIYAGLAFFLGLPAILLISGVWSRDEALITTGLIVGALMLPFAVYMLYCLRRPLLLLSAEGVLLRAAGGGEIRVPWDAIEALMLDSGAEGLVLKEPLQNRVMQTQRNWAGTRVNGVSMTPEKNLPLIAEFRFIPLTGFAEWFEQGNLLAAFQAFAPHLASDFPQRRGNVKEAARTARKVWIWIGVFVIVFFGLAFWVAQTDLVGSPAWTRVSGWILKLGFIALAVGLSAAVWSNLRASRRLLGERQWGVALFWFLAALVQAAMVLFALAQILS